MRRGGTTTSNMSGPISKPPTTTVAKDAVLKSPIGSVVISCYLGNRAGVAESADASDLSENLSARRETGDAELLKIGESLTGQSRAKPGPKTAGKV
jgi:hypothetical protein